MSEYPRTVIVIPTYNEAENIPGLIEQILWLHPQIDILIVDANSPDGTASVVKGLANKNKQIKLLLQPVKTGLGGAYIEGFRHILIQEPLYQRVIEMDADFSHDPRYLAELLEALEENDLILGSRYIPGGGIKGWKWHRLVLSCLGNQYVRFWLKLGAKDCTSGFRCFRRVVLANINLDSIQSKGYLFQVEVLFRSCQAGYRAAEVPIIFIDRKIGKTKLGVSEVWEAVWGVPKLRFAGRRSGDYEKKS